MCNEAIGFRPCPRIYDVPVCVDGLMLLALTHRGRHPSVTG